MTRPPYRHSEGNSVLPTAAEFDAHESNICPLCDDPITHGQAKVEWQVSFDEWHDAHADCADNYDPTPWCNDCGAKTSAGCDCPPPADNE